MSNGRNPANIRPDGWNWSMDPSFVHTHVQTHDLRDHEGHLLAWAQSRPHYCDRGHWKGVIEIPCGLDSQDGWPNYYMSLKRAKTEVEAFLRWRLFQVRCGE